jgi:membrane protease YdiL (CAAX protease family)
VTWLRQHFERCRQRHPWDFCWRIAVEGTIASLTIAFILTLLIGEPDREFPDWPMAGLFLVIVLIAPPVETLLCQALPIFIVRKLRASFRWQVICSTVFFAACHLPEGFITTIAAGAVGGFYFAFAYAHWREKSRWTSFWVTSVSHSIHNLIVWILLLLVGDL